VQTASAQISCIGSTCACLGKTNIDSVGECGRLSQPSWLLDALKNCSTYLLT